MSVEIANLVSAMGLLGLNSGSGSEIIKGFGLRAVTRIATGEFRVQLEQPVTFFGGLPMVTPMGTPARIVAAALIETATGPYEAGDLQILTKDAAGAAVDGTGVTLTVLKFPTVS